MERTHELQIFPNSPVGGLGPMETFPVQLALFGFVDRFLEPFCYGCAGFLISYRFSRSVPAKVLAMLTTAVFFLWMDDIWPAIGFRSAKVGIASGNRAFAEMLEGNSQLGQANFSTGEHTGLWGAFNLDAWDVASAALFVPLAFQVGLLLTRRRWDELSIHGGGPPPLPPTSGRAPSTPQPPVARGSAPPPPPFSTP